LVVLFFFRDHPRVAAMQRGATDTVAFTAGLVLAPLDAWDRLVAAFESRNALQDEVLRLEQENRVLKGQTQFGPGYRGRISGGANYLSFARSRSPRGDFG
jgi:hypothetical protein